MQNSVFRAVSKVSRGFYVIVWGTTTVLAITNLSSFFLDTGGRFAVILLGIIGPCLFLVSRYLHQSRLLAGSGDRWFFWKSFGTVLILFTPTVVLIVRYSWASVEAVGYLKTLAQLPLFCLGYEWMRRVLPESTPEVLDIFSQHLKEIMWTSWSRHDAEMPGRLNWDGERALQFATSDGLRIFQESLSCPIVDSAAAAEICKPLLNGPKSISILDIGGGDGRFTARLIECLHRDGIIVSELMMIDPVDWQSDYLRNIGNVTGTAVSITVEKFMKVPVQRGYDLVVASHSLYADLDGTTTVQQTENVLKRVMSWCKPGGVALIILASRLSLALRFKDRAFRMLFGKPLNELAAEDLVSVLAGMGGAPTYVDDLMDLSRPMELLQRGDESLLAHWLDYFLRIPISRSSAVARELIDELGMWVQPFESLPESEQTRYQSAGLRLPRVSPVLPHKVAIWALKGKQP